MAQIRLKGSDVVEKIVNKRLYPDGKWVDESNNLYFTRVCMWASENGLDEREFILPQVQVETEINPFAFERNFPRLNIASPSKAEIDAVGPWDYQIEWPNITTRGERIPREWLFHRYRAALFSPLLKALAGQDLETCKLIDVACHCGVFALEFAAQGFKKVLGLDLRQQNINQANFLKNSFKVPGPEFRVENVLELPKYNADIVFCGGLLYHVTFPVKLIEDLFNATNKFLILDSLSQNHPFSGFHVYGERNIKSSIEGGEHFEFVPTYRGIIDVLKLVGFRQIYEVLGSAKDTVPYYASGNIRSFLCVKPDSGISEAELAGRFSKL